MSEGDAFWRVEERDISLVEIERRVETDRIDLAMKRIKDRLQKAEKGIPWDDLIGEFTLEKVTLDAATYILGAACVNEVFQLHDDIVSLSPVNH